MINTKGHFYTTTLDNLGLDNKSRKIATTNASNILASIITSYETSIGKGHVGATGTGIPIKFRHKDRGPSGLIYGRIQSGKTRAMITTAALAFDNSFRIAVVMTSNINDLVSQTHSDFSSLRGVGIYTKDDELSEHVEDAMLDLASTNGRILIITSKGGKSLSNVLDFLTKINAEAYPMLIFDDEGDQASLDTNTYKRSKTGDLTLAKSTINDLIDRIKTTFPCSVFISVTGTPQAVLLQTASSNNRPSFIEMLPPGSSYIGGDFFFSTAEPQDNPDNLISIVPNIDKVRLLNENSQFPDGLRDSIVFFLLSAAAAKQNLGWPANGKGYQFLCHPSLKNNEQDQAKKRVSSYLTEVKKILMGYADTLGINAALAEQYRFLQTKLGLKNTPSLAVLKGVIDEALKSKKILVINAANAKRKGIEYGPGFNFLIGGNTLGRGIAIPNLLVTYYVRQSITSQMDTMHQHARMFGYREATLPYTKLFTTSQLYYRFRDIHSSDRILREFINDHKNELDAFPIDTSIGLTPTRRGVLDSESIEAIGPGMQIYPNKMKLPQSVKNVEDAMVILYRLFNVKEGDKAKLEKVGKAGIIISLEEAKSILGLIKTQAQNSWHDSTIQTVLMKICERLNSSVRLKYRPAERTVDTEGYISSGTLSGAEQETARRDQHPTLWIMDVTPKSTTGNSLVFIFPTIVVPSRLPRVFVFNKH